MIVLAIGGALVGLAFLGGGIAMAISSLQDGDTGLAIGLLALTLGVFFLIAGLFLTADNNVVTVHVTDQGCYRTEMVGKITREIPVRCPEDK